MREIDDSTNAFVLFSFTNWLTFLDDKVPSLNSGVSFTNSFFFVVGPVLPMVVKVIALDLDLDILIFSGS